MKDNFSHSATIFPVKNIQEIYEKCLSEGVKILNAPETRDYNMTDFDILDPDGYLITFGNGS